MKNIVIATVCSMALGLTAAAQTSPNSSYPSGSSAGQTTSQSPDTNSGMNSGNQGSNNGTNSGMNSGMNNGMNSGSTNTHGEKKLKGCIKSEGGSYVLEEKNGKKEVALTGSQDFASHVGQMVTVRGTFSGGSSAPGNNPSSANPSSTTDDMSKSSSNSGMSSNGQFMVTKLDMTSGSCNTDKGMGMNKNTTDQDNTGKPSPNHK